MITDYPLIKIPEDAHIETRGTLKVPLVFIGDCVIGTIAPTDPEGFMRVTAASSCVLVSKDGTVSFVDPPTEWDKEPSFNIPL